MSICAERTRFEYGVELFHLYDPDLSSSRSVGTGQNATFELVPQFTMMFKSLANLHIWSCTLAIAVVKIGRQMNTILGCYKRNTQHPLPKSTPNQYFNFQIFYMSPGELYSGIQYAPVSIHRTPFLFWGTSGWDVVHLVYALEHIVKLKLGSRVLTSSTPYPNQMCHDTKMGFAVYTLRHTVYHITAPQMTCGISENWNTGLGYFLAGDAKCFVYRTPGSCPFAFRFLPQLEL